MLLIRQSTHIIAGKRLICQGAQAFDACLFALACAEKKQENLHTSRNYIYAKKNCCVCDLQLYRQICDKVIEPTGARMVA
jgi:hypothetical protein